MCGNKTHSTIDGCSGLDLCRSCRESAELENEHFDGHHEATPVQNCPHCVKFIPGSRVRANNFEGVITKICDGQLTGKAEVRLCSGTVCVDISDLSWA